MSISTVVKVMEKATAILYDLQTVFSNLESEVSGATEELSYLWQGFLPKLTKSCLLLKYVETGELLTKQEVAAMLGSKY
jgi:hypothetical protein